jgi:calcineurin-like phosphoesterase family protein
MTTWVTADWHLDHKNVLVYDNRPWTDVEEMNHDIISIMSHHIQEEDTLIYLGDLALTRRDRYVEWLKLMKHLWPNLIFIHGNHDKGFHSTVWEEAGVNIMKQYKLDRYIFTHAPIEKVPRYMVNVHGHTHKPSRNMSYLSVSVNLPVLDYMPVKVVI